MYVTGATLGARQSEVVCNRPRYCAGMICDRIALHASTRTASEFSSTEEELWNQPGSRAPGTEKGLDVVHPTL